MGYRLARFIVVLLVRLTTRITVHGYENVPSKGGFIIASNHLGRLDVPLIYALTDRQDIILLVAEKYHQSRWARWFVKQLNLLWVDRFNADFSTLRETLKRLEDGAVLVLAPEGTRSPTGALIEARPGGSYLASKAGVPIVPVALVGTEDKVFKAQLKRLRRTHVTARVGEPFTIPPVRGKDREAQLKIYTDEIMCRIAAQLPPSYRGFYADHPRLQELLQAPLPSVPQDEDDSVL